MYLYCNSNLCKQFWASFEAGCWHSSIQSCVNLSSLKEMLHNNCCVSCTGPLVLESHLAAQLRLVLEVWRLLKHQLLLSVTGTVAQHAGREDGGAPRKSWQVLLFLCQTVYLHANHWCDPMKTCESYLNDTNKRKHLKRAVIEVHLN